MTNLKELRVKNKLTQQELAYRIGVTPRFIGFLETGDRKPSLEIADKIAKILGASIEEIFLSIKCTKST